MADMPDSPLPSPESPAGTFDLAASLTVLRSTPSALSALLAPLPDAWTEVNEGRGTWSPRQVVQHLIWGEVDDWLPRVRCIYDHGESQPFRPFDREEGFRRYAGLSLGELLAEFTRTRGESLYAIDRLHLDGADLQRSGRHPELGMVTLQQLLATWVTHDLGHLAQVTRVLTKHAGTWAGPWRAYFNLLRVDGPSRG